MHRRSPIRDVVCDIHVHVGHLLRPAEIEEAEIAPIASLLTSASPLRQHYCLVNSSDLIIISPGLKHEVWFLVSSLPFQISRLGVKIFASSAEFV